jgi:hypothetical protein
MSHVMAEEAESQLQEPTSLNANENGLTTTTSGRLMPVDCYVPYPVQNSLPYFPQGLKQRCLQELAAQLSMNREVQAAKQQQRKSGGEDIHDGPGLLGEQDDDFDTFSLALFGPTLQRIFIRPYNEKAGILCKSLTDIRPSISRRSGQCLWAKWAPAGCAAACRSSTGPS